MNEKIAKNYPEKLKLIEKLFINDQFDNLDSVKNYKGEMLLIHGKLDDIIHVSHAQNLVKGYQESGRKCDYYEFPDMSHNNFDMESQILKPIKNFLAN